MNEKLLAEFEKYLLEENSFSNNTIDSYVLDIKKILLFLDDVNIVNWIEEDRNIYQYISKLKKEGYTQATLIRKVASINKFLKFSQINKYIKSYNKISLVNKKKNIENDLVILSKDEINDVLNFVPKSFIEFRDKAIFELVYAIGIKPTECIKLKIDSVNLDIGYLKYKNNKNDSVIVALPKQTIIALNEYLVELGKMNCLGNIYLFVSENGKIITRQGFWKIFKKRKKEMNLKSDLTPTIFRNSLVVHLLEENISPENVKDFLGLTSISSILNYIKKTKKENLSRKIINNHPRNNMKE